MLSAEQVNQPFLGDPQLEHARHASRASRAPVAERRAPPLNTRTAVAPAAPQVWPNESLRIARLEAVAAQKRLSALVSVATRSGCSEELGPKSEICKDSDACSLRAAVRASHRKHGRSRHRGACQSKPCYSWLGSEVAFNNSAGQIVHVYTPRRALAEKRRLQKEADKFSKEPIQLPASLDISVAPSVIGGSSLAGHAGSYGSMTEVLKPLESLGPRRIP